MSFPYEQIIFPAYDTTIDSAHTKTQLRITRNSAVPLGGLRHRGKWSATANYVIDDLVGDTSNVVWRSKTANINVTPVEGADWTQATKFWWAHPDPTKVLILQTVGGSLGANRSALVTINAPSIASPAPLDRHISREEGKLTPDKREYVFNDTVSYAGTDGNGTPVSGIYTTTTLFNEIFDNPNNIATFTQNRVLNPAAAWNDATGFELYWIGDGSVSLKTSNDIYNLSDTDVNAIQSYQQIKLTVEGGIRRAQTLTIRDLLLILDGSDISDVRAFYGGPLPKFSDANLLDSYVRRGGRFFNGGVNNGVYTGDWIAKFDEVGDQSGICLAATRTNDGLHAVNLFSFLTKICAILGVEFGGVLSAASFWLDKCNQTTNLIESVKIDIGDLSLCYEYLIGSDPRCDINVAEMSSPVTFTWDTPLSTVLEKVMRDPFCRLDITYDQTAKQQIWTLVSESMLNAASHTTTTGTVAQGATTAVVASLSALKGTASYPFFAQFRLNGSPALTQTMEVISDDSVNTITFTLRDDSVAWPSGTFVDRIQTLNPKWRLGPNSRKDQAIVSAPHVETKSMGGDDVLACPHSRGSALEFERFRRAKKFGPLNSNAIDITDATYNRSVALIDQPSCWIPLSGGTQHGMHIVQDDATVTYTGGTGTHYYTVQSLKSDFSYLQTAPFDVATISNLGGDPFYVQDASAHTFVDPTKADVVVFPNGAFGVVEGIIDRNTIKIAVQFLGVYPVTGSSKHFAIGYGAYSEQCTVTDGSDEISVTGFNFGQNDANMKLVVGQQVVIPARGIFHIVRAGTAGDPTNMGKATLDAPVSISGTNLRIRIGGPELNPNGWLFASYYYYDNTTYKRYPSQLYLTDTWDANGTHNTFHSNDMADPQYWYGCLNISRIDVGLPEGNTDAGNLTIPPDDNHGNNLWSAAQFFASRYIGNFSQLDREYDGATDSTGSLALFRNGDSFQEQREGQVRQYEVVGHSLSEYGQGRGRVHINALEWPNFSKALTAVNFPVVLKNSTNSSSGEALGVGNSGSGSSSASNNPNVGSAIWQPAFFTLTGAGVIVAKTIDTYYLCTDATTTGVTAPPKPTKGCIIIITNQTGADFLAGNFWIPNNGTWTLIFGDVTKQSDLTLPFGWNLMGRSA